MVVTVTTTFSPCAEIFVRHDSIILGMEKEMEREGEWYYHHHFVSQVMTLIKTITRAPIKRLKSAGYYTI